MTSNNKTDSGKSLKQEEYNVIIQYINSLIKYKSNINKWVIFELLLTFVILVLLFGTIIIYQYPINSLLFTCSGIILMIRIILLLKIIMDV